MFEIFPTKSIYSALTIVVSCGIFSATFGFDMIVAEGSNATLQIQEDSKGLQ